MKVIPLSNRVPFKDPLPLYYFYNTLALSNVLYYNFNLKVWLKILFVLNIRKFKFVLKCIFAIKLANGYEICKYQINTVYYDEIQTKIAFMLSFPYESQTNTFIV